jgi:asparagine synthase (glutamine-hydrolysing)
VETGFSIRGWVECGDRLLTPAEVETAFPGEARRFGGEFLIRRGDCCARDHFGIMPGGCLPGRVVCRGFGGTVEPEVPAMELGEAIARAVALRAGRGVTALSGGVDSSLIAALAGLPCVAIGTPGAYDLARARETAQALGLSLTSIIVTREEIREALGAVVQEIPGMTPVEASITATQYLVAGWAAGAGYDRVLSGQGADELFGGYARYLRCSDLGAELARDFTSLLRQVGRDQAAAGLHGCWFSLPYLDLRVVRAAAAIPAAEKVRDGVRKLPLRTVAARHLPPEIAWREKRAMQYGSGIWKAIRALARDNGYKKSVQGYIDQLAGR